MQHEKDKKQHQSKQYTAAFFEEGTHFTESQFWYIVGTRVRKQTAHTRSFAFVTCNPDPDSFIRDLIDWWIGPDGYPIYERSGVLRYFIRVNEQLVVDDFDFIEHETIHSLERLQDVLTHARSFGLGQAGEAGGRVLGPAHARSLGSIAT